MPDWLFPSGFSRETQFALWSIAAVTATTLLLFAYTMGLRLATMRGARRRRRVILSWRDQFAGAALDRTFAAEVALPPIAGRDETTLIEEWNRIRASIEGDAAENLNVLARRAGIDHIAGRLFHGHDLRQKLLAIQTLGYLREEAYIDALLPLLNAGNTALSMTAALALVEIDPDAAVARFVPLIAERRDWPRTQVSLFLRVAGSERVSEPLYRALRSADEAATTYLLQFASLMEADVLDALVVELIRESRDPGVLNAALKLVSGFTGVPRLAALTRNDTWYVRMQAAKVLGRLGEQEHVSLLESLLEDSEWWVRYRAAQSLVSLPFLGPNRLREIRNRQKDRYAADIMAQAFAEVGLA